MKKIEAIIRPEMFESVRDALLKIGCQGLTVSEVEGHGKQKGLVQQWRGEKYQVYLLPKLKLEIVARDRDVELIVRTIMDSAGTGQIGDGKIFVYDVSTAVRIRTGEKGEKAL